MLRHRLRMERPDSFAMSGRKRTLPEEIVDDEEASWEKLF